MQARVSVIMSTFQQAAFLRRALESLLAQTFEDWELFVIDDGSADETPAIINRYLRDPRIHSLRMERNVGMGAAINAGLDASTAPLIAYLPSDDVYYRTHLASLIQCLEDFPNAVLAFSGIRHHYNRYSLSNPPNEPLQPVQVMHRRNQARWLTREELVTDDLERMFLRRLREYGEFIGTGAVTCEWVDHARQRHKVLRESEGGINPYRVQYGVKEPVNFHSTTGNHIDEKTLYERFRNDAAPVFDKDGLKILLVGELAYNPDRILALEERGHRLYGLWTPEPWWYNWVGPLPFGKIEDIPLSGWRQAVERIRPDVIYGLLNWQAVPFVHEIVSQISGIPFIWHFKESPYICLERGTWGQLIDLYLRADGYIFCNQETRDWFNLVLPQSAQSKLSILLDGDLPKRDWFAGNPSRRLSEIDGEIHTVVPGRPIGLHPKDVAELASYGVHLHFYGDFTQGQWKSWIEKTLALAPKHLHLHKHVDPDRWLEELSQYDAGWLHYFQSENCGDLMRANWDDLNYPARLSTLAAAGLPLIQRDNSGSRVAIQSLAKEMDIGVFATSMEHLASQLQDSRRLTELRRNIWLRRANFTFDYHTARLTAFFREVISAAACGSAGSTEFVKRVNPL
ncbi:MAG: glycosyltransferase [Bryobacteraceae bacterium]|nr:glycosyltransferase [Bryobacteraceae bacterium]